MKTKFGEVKSYRDLFEKIREYPDGGKSVEEGGMGEIIAEVWKCKVCGDKIEGVGGDGFISSNMILIENVAKEHLELHKTLKEIDE